MTKRARNLARELRACGWHRGMDIRKTEMFQHLSEACGCDVDGNAIEGAPRGDLHLGDDAAGYSIRDLYEQLVVNRGDGEPVGSAFIEEYFNPRHQRTLIEAGGAIDAVDSTAFMGITGQLMVTQILQPYQKEEYIVRKLIPTYNSPLEQEKWIGIAPIKDPSEDILRVEEKEPFRMLGLGEQYVQTPITKKRGALIGLTKEAIFFDRTGDLVKQAGDLGDILAYGEERECIGAVIGATAAPVRFVEKRQFDMAPVTIDLFQAADGSGAYQLAGTTYSSRLYPYINDVPDNPLEDYTAVELADQYFSVTLDPNRGRPIVVGRPYILAPHTKRINIARVLQAENVWKLTQQGLTTAGAVVTNGPNPLGRIGMGVDQIAVSRMLQLELQTQLGLTAAEAMNVWFYGDIAQTFKYVTNWPVQVVQAPVNSEAEFTQDIVMRWKASKRGCIAIAEGRTWQRHNFLRENSSAGGVKTFPH